MKMADRDMALMAHLMRRAGFGAARSELERRTAKGYEATVEELLDPAAHGVPPLDTSVLFRQTPGFRIPGNPENASGYWMYRMIHTPRPLEEKISLLWHQVFATANSKVNNPPEVVRQIEMFREYGMGGYRRLLVELAKNPAMIFWLDNQENHKDAPNENWGRELLELFSMGQGNYTEEDVKECARAFTGWTLAPTLPGVLYNRFPWQFKYDAEDHDDGEKVFLGQKGRFNGEDVIDIIMGHPATAQFVARHLYNFFVADEVQVPSWQDEPPRDPEAAAIIAEALVASDFDIRSTLRVIFNSDFFKDEEVWFAKVKSPTELVVSAMRLVQDFQEYRPGIWTIGMETSYQGQAILNPPSVEGWHTGQEWIDSGALLQRINFVADRVGDVSLPGVRDIVKRLSDKNVLSAGELVDGCLDLLGHVRLTDDTRQELIEHVSGWEEARRGETEEERVAFGAKVADVLKLITATREYQLG